MDYQEVKRFHWFWMCIWRMMNHGINYLMTVLLQMDVLWIVCSCRTSSSEGLYFSDVDGLLTGEVVFACSWIFLEFKDQSGWIGLSSCQIFFSMWSTLSVISASFKLTNCCNNVLVFFLIGFHYWLWNGVTESIKNESSRLVLIFSWSFWQTENWSFPKSAKFGRKSFGEGSTATLMTRFSLIIMGQCRKWNCGDICLCFNWLLLFLLSKTRNHHICYRKTFVLRMNETRFWNLVKFVSEV